MRVIIGISLIALSSWSYGQGTSKKNISYQHLLWFRYSNKLSFNEHWMLNTQIENRIYFNPWKQHTFIARTQLYYIFNSTISVSQGFTFFSQSPHDQYGESRFAIPEYRPDQELTIRSNPWKKLKVQHRYKLEERFFHKADTKTEKLLPGYNFNFRLRYLLQFQYSLFNIKENRPLKLIVADEIMANFGKNIVYNALDQNRFTIGLAYDFSDSFGVEADYINWFQQRNTGKDYYNRDIGRFTLFHNIDLQKMKKKKQRGKEEAEEKKP